MIDITQYIFDTFISEGLLVIIACYVLGNIITKLISKINNNHTVPILSVAGAVLVLVLGTYPSDPVGVRIVKGCVLGWSSTGMHELFKAFVRLGYIKIPGYNAYNNTNQNNNKNDIDYDSGKDPDG